MSETASKPKTVLAPCMGVGKIVANVTRRASYLIQNQCPDEVELLSLPALLAGDAYERELIQKHPVIAIDGCALRCAAHIFRQFGVEPVAKVEVNQVMKEQKLGPGKTRKQLEETGKRLSDFTAERVLRALHDEGLDASFAPADELTEPPPDAGAGCPHRPGALTGHAPPPHPGLAALARPSPQSGEGVDAAIAEAAANTGVCQSGPAGEQTSTGKHRVNSVTVIPCQGIKRTGGRITQRAAYDVVEDRFLGRSQVLCISALAAGVQEDVDMLEKFPSVAVNGCGLRCASVAAQHYGIPAVAHVELTEVDPAFNGEAQCLEPDLTPAEVAESNKLADAIAAKVEGLLGSEINWSPSKVNLHGLVHEPGQINALTGYADGGQGYLVQLAKQQLQRDGAASVPAPKPSEEPASFGVECITGKTVISNLFKPKPRPNSAEGQQ